MFTDIHSWLDVSQPTLKGTEWRPEGAQPQQKNVERAIPPEESEAHFYPDRSYTRPERWVIHEGTRVAASREDIFAREVTIDETVAIIALLFGNGRVLTGNGFVH